ncbi:hypothetical protein M0R45_022618 [Rubus argutus]|uniref:Uncharacterized protein n=1 Tax=Rubus argutus TaxID=59490 RepID=A0AAW1XFU5_RUBAR
MAFNSSRRRCLQVVDAVNHRAAPPAPSPSISTALGGVPMFSPYPIRAPAWIVALCHINHNHGVPLGPALYMLIKKKNGEDANDHTSTG